MYSTVIPNSRFYTVRYRCNNCGFVFSKNIKYGAPAPHSFTCDNCGCQATKDNWVRPSPRPIEPYIRPVGPPPWRRDGRVFVCRI